MKSITFTEMSDNVTVVGPEPNWFMLAGVAVGVVVGLIICVFLFRILRGRWGIASKYDERQQAARGKAYRNAFWTLIGYISLWYVLDVCDVVLPRMEYLLLGGILLGLMVQIISSVMMDAYYGLNDDPKKFMTTLAVLDVFNLMLFVVGKMMGNRIYWTNLAVVIMGGALFIAVGIKALLNRRNAGEDE